MSVDLRSAQHAITGLILAGGQARRMGNLDKGLQELNGTSLIQHVIVRLKPQVDVVAINANRNLARYSELELPVWPDNGINECPPDDNDFRGPLAGVETGLRHCRTPYLLTVPCDSPFLPLNLATRLMSTLEEHHADIAVACTEGKNQLRLQPVFCLIHRSLLHQLQSYLNSGGRKMDGWYGDANVAKVVFSNESEFINLNTLEELRMCAKATLTR